MLAGRVWLSWNTIIRNPRPREAGELEVDALAAAKGFRRPQLEETW